MRKNPGLVGAMREENDMSSSILYEQLKDDKEEKNDRRNPASARTFRKHGLS